MKSKITKIQILKKGMAILLASMFMITPISYASVSLVDNYLESSFIERLLYGTIGSTANEIKKWFEEENNTTLYITNETQLRAFAEYVNNNKKPCIGKEIILLNDINLDSNIEWTPIGNYENVWFKGTFNGNGHTIRGVTYLNNEVTGKTNSYIGLFGIIGEEGTVKNLIVEDFNINLYNSSSSSNVGNIAGCSYGTISNCINRSNISGIQNVGGIVGFIEYNAKIDNCINTGNVEGFKYYVGGIVGQNKADINSEAQQQYRYNIKNCKNIGNIKGAQSIGGIVGSTEKANSKIINCTNDGRVEGDKHIGGIVGYSKSPEIERCINNGEINAVDGYVGGIVGKTNSSNDTHINRCINNGDVISNYKYIGGIVGYLEGKATSKNEFDEKLIQYCKNTGTIRK